MSALRTDVNDNEIHKLPYHKNFLRSDPGRLIDSAQRPVAKYLYDPYGNTIAKSGALAEANTHRFSSKRFDEKTGLYHFGRRFYDPSLQRWLNRDPIGMEGGGNLHSYVGNRPVNAIDPDGRQTWMPYPSPGRNIADPSKPAYDMYIKWDEQQSGRDDGALGATFISISYYGTTDEWGSQIEATRTPQLTVSWWWDNSDAMRIESLRLIDAETLAAQYASELRKVPVQFEKS